MTRGLNIIAYGWAGASNPHPHSNPHLTPLHTVLHKKYLKRSYFSLFDLIITEGRKDGPIDQWTDKASYRVACPQLKIVSHRRCINRIRLTLTS